MHELGLIIDVVEKVDRIAEEQNLKKIDKVVLQVGEAFSVVPQMMKAVYRRSIPGTRLEGSALEIEIIEASAKCRNCGSVFNPFTCDAQCPCCQESEYTVLSGKEFLIKEILAWLAEAPRAGRSGSFAKRRTRLLWKIIE